MSPEELKALLSTPVALFVLMLVGSLASMLKQVSDARSNDTDVTLGSYLAHWPETITTIIGNIFAFIGLLMVDQLNFASAVGIGYIANSSADLVRSAGRSAAVAGKVSAHWIVTMLAILTTLVLLSGCQATPVSVLKVACAEQQAYRTERCAKAVAETYEVYQRRGYELMARADTATEVREHIRKADATGTPAIVQVLRVTRSVVAIQQQLAAGTVTEATLAAEQEKLSKLVAEAIGHVSALITALGG